MIPYDDLVAALQAWRARQGLPVSTSREPALAPSVTTSNGQSIATAPYQTQPRSAPPRPGAPPASPKRSTAPRMPAPLSPIDTADEQLDNLEVEDSALMEENHYENEGDDFAMSFGHNNGRRGGRAHQSSEETLVGGDDAPESTDPARTRDDW